MKIKEMLEDSRPRERFLKQGQEALSDTDLRVSLGEDFKNSMN